jgi:protein tyrosine/serine phosphatase
VPTYDDRVTERWIHLDGLVNMRDLGGLPTHDGRTTVPRRLIRSDNLQDLTEADVRRLVDELGVTDVVDLRTETEVNLEGPGPLRRVESLAHHHHSLVTERPADDPERVGERALALTDDTGRRGGEFWARHYLGYLSKRPDSVAAALEVVSTAHGAAVVHCAAGKDRTGTVVAMALDVAGVPHEEIVADYLLTAERLEAIIGRLLPRPSYGEALARQQPGEQLPRPESIEAILTAVSEGWGGAAGWLRDHGWSAADVERLRERLTRP